VVRYAIAVIALLIGLLYSFAFLMWNSADKVNVVTWRLLVPNPLWVEGVPVGILPLLGVLIGALVMLVATWSPWARQRAAARAAEEKMQKAIQRFNEQKARLAAQNEEIGGLEEQVATLQAAVARQTSGNDLAQEAHPTPGPAADEVVESARAVDDLADGQ